MAPRVLVDSDDGSDAEDLSLGAQVEDDATSNRFSTKTTISQVIAEIRGTNHDAVTASTDQPQERIDTSERSLYQGSVASGAMPRHSSSPMANLKKRRHTTAAEKNANVIRSSGNSKAKRVKSAHLSSTKERLSSQPGDTDIFGGLQPMSSCLGFTEHSPEACSSSHKYDNLINDESMMLFSETSSTVRDTSSLQEHLLQQLQAQSAARLASNGSDDVQEDHKSTFPWSLSSNTHYKSDEETIKYTTEAHLHAQNYIHLPEIVHQEDIETSVSLPELEVNGAMVTHYEHITNATSSPNLPTCVQNPSTPEDTNSETPDPLTDIGPPKEMYKPRPSRRRATYTFEECANEPTRPEKTMRPRRSKTSQATVDYKRTEHASESSQIQIADIKHGLKATPLVSADDPLLDRSHDSEVDGVINLSRIDAITHHTPLESSLSQTDGIDEAIFVKPTKSKPKRQEKRNTLRSYTTIFEDHVDLVHTEHTISLSQQQTQRMSSLQDLTHKIISSELNNPSGFQHGHVCPVEGKDVDPRSPASINGDVHEPANRKRRRPPKTVSSTENSRLKQVVDDANQDEVHNLPGEPENKLAKRGRGRPPKTPISVAESNDTMTEDANSDDKFKSSPTKQMIDSRVHTVISEEATPEQQAIGDVQIIPASTPPKRADATPLAHSPIKTSKVPLRVGLNRRLRIPSLLRTINPRRKEA